MARYSYLVFFVISHLLFLSLAEEENKLNQMCPSSVRCGNLSPFKFPFTNLTYPKCGLMVVDKCKETVQRIHLGKNGPSYNIKNIAQDGSITLEDPVLQNHLNRNSCESFKNLTLPRSSPFLSFSPISSNLSLFKCTHKLDSNIPTFNKCNGYFIYYNHPDDQSPSIVPPNCSLIQLPVNKTRESLGLFNMLTSVFSLQVNVTLDCNRCHFIRRGQCQNDSKGNFQCQLTKECNECHMKGGQCQRDSKGNFHCQQTRECNDCHTKGGDCRRDSKGNFQCLNIRRDVKITQEDRHLKLKLALGLGGGIGLIVLIALLSCILCYHKRQKYDSAKSDRDIDTVYFGVPIFSYGDLAKATNNFNSEKELGDGGFGSVYYGKLRDGREVAVKRLYEHNGRRVEQFMNEVEILTRLHHKNLVSLYGCTSRYSQGLLLVYEFVPNGTVADHLHGDRHRPKPGLLTWPIRMKIAIETASALAYLHASDIIHRDVKTHNILLDSNFCVKLADFGISRWFPIDATHVSTGPQGTPGYVDPEYHQCFQLTDKSDVYSFGVVLIELISSMPVVDMNRHRHEINLANLAMNKIQKGAIDELIDPCLGCHSDEEVKRMTTSVAELAFLCLQQDKEMRPSMDEVLEQLEKIKSGESKFEKHKGKQDDNEVIISTQPLPSPPHCDEDSLLNSISLSPSPISVTGKLASSSTTSYASS